jgi:hypothetical protein
MEVDDDPRMPPDALHGVRISVTGQRSTPKNVGHVATRGHLAMTYDRLNVAERRVLGRRQTSEFGVLLLLCHAN